jgi:hypothetical protein
MDKVEDAVAGQRHDDDPETGPESGNRSSQESGANRRFEQQDPAAPAHHAEQDIVRRDNDQHDRIEHALAVEPGKPGGGAYHQGEDEANQVGHRRRALRSKPDSLPGNLWS